MKFAGTAYQMIAAGGGFFLGFFWGVCLWAERVSSGGEALVRAALAPGGALAAGYALVLGCFFWAEFPSARVVGLRSAAAPTAFTLSLLAGFLGIRGALWFLGG
ncbi:MAG: hypothetical protein IH608_04755 [Proteobacteria bacterium]|nr:hypothetical protein [Pseudomonadota bacterium]